MVWVNCALWNCAALDCGALQKVFNDCTQLVSRHWAEMVEIASYSGGEIARDSGWEIATGSCWEIAKSSWREIAKVRGWEISTDSGWEIAIDSGWEEARVNCYNKKNPGCEKDSGTSGGVVSVYFNVFGPLLAFVQN